jgi:adenine/guanine phosphoribosyltransferase-like PRPP-binding protein
MNRLPCTTLAVRLNAFLAATVVTLAMLAGIDTLATAERAAAPLAQAVALQPA